MFYVYFLIKENGNFNDGNFFLPENTNRLLSLFLNNNRKHDKKKDYHKVN